MSDFSRTIAPCGLVCDLCANASPEKHGCVGCADGGGNVNCEQRKCCTTKSIKGCWECIEFPCEKGYLAETNVEWRGMCVASIQGIRDCGLTQFIAGMEKRFPQGIEYGNYRYKSIAECIMAFYEQESTQPASQLDRSCSGTSVKDK